MIVVSFFFFFVYGNMHVRMHLKLTPVRNAALLLTMRNTLAFRCDARQRWRDRRVRVPQQRKPHSRKFHY